MGGQVRGEDGSDLPHFPLLLCVEGGAAPERAWQLRVTLHKAAREGFWALFFLAGTGSYLKWSLSH